MNISFPSLSLNEAASCIFYNVKAAFQNEKIEKTALKVLTELGKAALQTGLVLGKAVIVPVEVAVIAVVATLTAIALLVSLPYQSTVSEQKIHTYHRLNSVLDDLIEVLWITLRYGVVKEEEEYRSVDGRPDSPQYVVIRPGLHSRSSAKPVIYAPGYLDSPDTLRETCRKIAISYGAPVYIVKYRSFWQSIDEHAKDVGSVNECMVRETNRREVVLMGHSMGGLTTGLAILGNHVNNVQVKLWITIGSPHQGDPLAPIGLGDCSKDMNVNSEVIKRLNEPSHLDQIPQLHISSLADYIVPPEYAVRKPSLNSKIYVCTKPHGHLSIRTCSEVFEQILQALLRS